MREVDEEIQGEPDDVKLTYADYMGMIADLNYHCLLITAEIEKISWKNIFSIWHFKKYYR